MDFLPTNTSQFYPIYYSTGQSEHLVCQHKTGRMFLATPKPTIEIWFSSAEKPRLGSIKYCDDRHKIFLESLNQYRIKKNHSMSIYYVTLKKIWINIDRTYLYHFHPFSFWRLDLPHEQKACHVELITFVRCFDRFFFHFRGWMTFAVKTWQSSAKWMQSII